MRPGDTIANRFEIVARAGSGGWGTVYRGRDRPGWRDVAIKILHPDADGDIYRFDQEARLLAEFDHPCIVDYVAHGHTMTGERYLVMEWIEGQTLADRLINQGLSSRQTVTMMRRVAEAIGYSHGRGVVHRDIKPTNILFAEGDVARVKVIDFGIALRTREAIRLTASGTVLGTPSYMAPEQARASKEIDSRSDVFSLGCVLFECLTGAVAFSGSNPLAVRAKALAVDPPPVRSLRPEIPEALDDLVTRMLAKDPGDRPPHAASVAAELARLPEPAEGAPVRRANRAAAAALETEETEVLELDTTEESKQPAAVILAAIPKDYANLTGDRTAQLESRKGAIEKVAAAHQAKLEILAGRAALLIIRGGSQEPFGQPARVADCALALREACPELSLVVTFGDDSSLHRTIDRGARTMEAAVQRAILAGGELDAAPAGAIRLDAYAAAVLEGAFRVSRPDPNTYFLDGRKATG